MSSKVNDLYRDKPKRNNKVLKMSLPVPPSVNAIYFNVRGGGRRLTAKANNYIRDARALINQYIEDQRWMKQTGRTWLYVDMVFYFPDRRIRDSHNCLKLLLDVMQGVVYENDMYALPRIHSVEYDKENPRVEMCISVQTEIERKRGIKTTEVVL